MLSISQSISLTKVNDMKKCHLPSWFSHSFGIQLYQIMLQLDSQTLLHIASAKPTQSQTVILSIIKSFPPPSLSVHKLFPFALEIRSHNHVTAHGEVLQMTYTSKSRACVHIAEVPSTHAGVN